MKHTILIIDDDKFVLNALEGRFSGWNTTVSTATTPEAAKQSIKTAVPDLILLDLILTKGDGAQDVLDFIKTDPKYAGIVVLALTNLENPEIKKMVMAQGVKEYLIKGTLGLDEIYKKAMAYLEPQAKKAKWHLNEPA